MKCTIDLNVFSQDIMELAFLYCINIVDQMITTGLPKVSKYLVPRKESSIPYIEILKIILR